MPSNDPLKTIRDTLELLETLALAMDTIDPLQRQDGLARFHRDRQEWDEDIRTIQEQMARRN